MATAGAFAGDGGDARLNHGAITADRNPSMTPGVGIRPQHRALHDSSVSFEEYHFYARKTREEENALAANDRGMLR